jgi:hypothetical protein
MNSQPYKGYKPDNTTHVSPGAPRVATIHDVTKKPGRVLPHPCTIFHMYASTDTPWEPEHYPIVHP